MYHCRGIAIGQAGCTFRSKKACGDRWRYPGTYAKAHSPLSQPIAICKKEKYGENGGLVQNEQIAFYKHSLRPSQEPTHPVHANPFYDHIVPLASLRKNKLFCFYGIPFLPCVRVVGLARVLTISITNNQHRPNTNLCAHYRQIDYQFEIYEFPNPLVLVFFGVIIDFFVDMYSVLETVYYFLAYTNNISTMISTL